MLIIPAIDIRAGNCVMLTQGKIEEETIYSKDPVFIAKLWQAKGAKRLHVIDLDGAFQGGPKNIEIIKKIRENVSIPIQAGGGIRNLKAVESLINMGINYVILGTIAIYNPDLLKEAVNKYGDKVIAALDARGDKVAIGGWKETTTVELNELAKKMKNAGIKEIIYTDINRDGMLKGLNLPGIKDVAKKSKLKIIASGGVSDIEDIRKVKEIESAGVSGVIIGKALYTEAIKLEDALKLE
jgi:phosphoribosylformimino-5-aminoimidazole carboxamide ribotide isomerase